MVVKTIKIFVVFSLITAAFGSCYYDKKAELYSGICDTTGMTYTKDIAPLVTNSCSMNGCHNSNSSTGISLTTYNEVKDCVTNGRFMGSVKQETNYSPMPKGGKWSSCDVSKLEAWLKAGCKL